MNFNDLLKEEFVIDPEDIISINGKNVKIIKNPNKAELKYIKTADRGFITKDGDVFIISNSGFLNHVILWENLYERAMDSSTDISVRRKLMPIAKLGSKYDELVRGKVILPIQYDDTHTEDDMNGFYLSEYLGNDDYMGKIGTGHASGFKQNYIKVINKTIKGLKVKGK